MDKFITVNEAANRTGVTSATIYRWIKAGNFSVERSRLQGRRSIKIDENSFNAFVGSDKFGGKPKDIGNTYAFRRTPVLEDCYPYNLLRSIINDRDDNLDEPEIDIWSIDMRAFRNCISRLTDREQRILELRYQFGLSLDETAAVINVTRERIRQIQIKAERKLSHRSNLKACTMVSREKCESLESKCRQLEADNLSLRTQLELAGKLPSPEPEKKNDTIDVDDIPIFNLDLSVRAYNCLMRAGIKSLGDILRFDIAQDESVDFDKKFHGTTWLTIRNLGHRTLSEIAKAVYRYCGYRIRVYNSNVIPAEYEIVPIDDVPDDAGVTADGRPGDAVPQ